MQLSKLTPMKIVKLSCFSKAQWWLELLQSKCSEINKIKFVFDLSPKLVSRVIHLFIACMQNTKALLAFVWTLPHKVNYLRHVRPVGISRMKICLWNACKCKMPYGLTETTTPSSLFICVAYLIRALHVFSRVIVAKI